MRIAVLSKRGKIRVAQALDDVKFGRVYSHEHVKRVLG